MLLGWYSMTGTPASARPWPGSSRFAQRRCWCLGGLGAATLLGLGGCATAPRPTLVPGGRQVVPFSASHRLGKVPQGWDLYVNRPDLPRTRYALAERDGRRVVHAVAESSTAGLRCGVDIDPASQPWLHWAWRVDRGMPEASVGVDELDDSPARVVLAFDGDHTQLSLRDRLFEDQVELFTGNRLPYATLAYVWDARAPVESVFVYLRSSRIRYLVVESGERGLGRWLTYRRNVIDDYRRIYGGEPGRIINIGILTDSDDLKVRAEAWFGDLMLV